MQKFIKITYNVIILGEKKSKEAKKYNVHFLFEKKTMFYLKTTFLVTGIKSNMKKIYI